MSGFEYIFTFYSLLLGLAVANVSGQLALMWRAGRHAGVGVAPPLLCLFILLGAAQQWTSFWSARDSLTMAPDTLLMSLGMALPYVFVSQAIDPAGENGGAFQAYYLKHRKTLLGALAIPPVLSFGYNLIFPGPDASVADFLMAGLLIVLPRVIVPVSLMFIRSPRVHAVGLGLLIAHTVWRLFL